MPKISVIVPTYNRQQHHRNLIRGFLAQTYPDTELLIYDDSEMPSAYLQSVCQAYENIHYFHAPERLTIGEKRNFLVGQARGELIAHFDDDDFYAPTYLQVMADALLQNNLDFLTLSSWFAYSVKFKLFAYWDTSQIGLINYKIGITPNAADISSLYPNNFPEANDFIAANVWGYGFSYIFKRAVFSQAEYPAINMGEDYSFYQRIIAAGFKTGFLPDTTGLVLHLIHETNTSYIFPQYLLPDFMLLQLFPGFARFLDHCSTSTLTSEK